MSNAKSAMSTEEKRLEIGKLRCFGPFERFLDLAEYREDTYARLQAEGIRLCQEYMPNTPHFFLVESARAQAVTIHDYAVVMVYRGMLDLIFNLASMMAATTPTPTPPPENSENPWRANMLAWLEQRDFWWENEKYWWLQCPEHRLVFDFYVNNLFKFVVLHEIGHQHNLHSRGREPKSAEVESTVDGGQADNGEKISMHKVEQDECNTLSSDQNISSHAREIIADTYAFQFLLEEMYAALYFSDEDKGKESAIAVASACSALSVTHLYFWASATLANQASIADMGKQCYPSHVFRIHAIEATFLEHGFPKLRDSSPSLPVSLALRKSNETFAAISERYPFIEWRREATRSEYEEHYRKILDEVSKWSNGFFGLKDEDLLDILR